MWVAAWNYVDEWLFGAKSRGIGPYAALLRLLRYPYAVLRDLSQGQLNLRAMGLVYATFLSVVPLLAFAFALLKGFGIHRDLEPVIYEFFKPIGDGAYEITQRIMTFADNVSTGLVGSVGFALLLWTLLGTIRKVEDSFNYVWHVEHPRSFARRIAEYVMLLIVGPILLVGFMGFARRTFSSEPFQAVAHMPLLDRVIAFGTSLWPFAMVTAIFTLVYMFVPNTRVRWRPALIGGFCAGFLWVAVGTLFTALVVLSSRLTIVYAGFAIVVAVLLWTYFGWLILLIGAQLSFYVQHPDYLRIGAKELRLSGKETEETALLVMYLVGRSHAEGSTRWGIQTLAIELGIPAIAIAQLAEALEKEQLLICTDDDQLLPGRDIGSIRLVQIIEVARNHHSGHVQVRELKVPPVDRLARSVETAWRETCGDRTLRDLVDEADEVVVPSPQLDAVKVHPLRPTA